MRGKSNAGFTLLEILEHPFASISRLASSLEMIGVIFPFVSSEVEKCQTDFWKKVKSGFTLLEILVVIAILGILMTVIVPNIRNVLPKRERAAFVAQLNGLTRFAWQRALIERKIHKVTVDFEKKIVTVQQATDLKDGEWQFGPIKGSFTKLIVKIPRTIEIRAFFIEGYDEMTRFAGGTKESYFYIVPEGLAQSVTIHFTDKSATSGAKPRPFSLILNPFTAQFTLYEGFKK